MTRKEQIKEAAFDYVANNYSPSDNDFQATMNISAATSFEAGAEWQKNYDEQRRAFLNLKEVKDAWNKLNENNPHIASSVAFLRGAEWADKTLINKACKWLKENKDNYAYPVYEGDTLTDECFVGESLIDDFRKAMEE